MTLYTYIYIYSLPGRSLEGFRFVLSLLVAEGVLTYSFQSIPAPINVFQTTRHLSDGHVLNIQIYILEHRQSLSSVSGMMLPLFHHP